MNRLTSELQLSVGREQALRRETQSISAEKSLIEEKLKKFSFELDKLNSEQNSMVELKLAVENEREARCQAEASLGRMKLSLQKAVDQRLVLLLNCLRNDKLNKGQFRRWRAGSWQPRTQRPRERKSRH